jgi:hypothetical protein
MRLLLVVVVGLSAGCSGGGGTSSVPRAVADGWSAKWCQAAPGNTKEQLIGIMGAATSTTDTTLMWAAYQYQFNAFLDPDGTVRQLDVNTHSLSEAEQAAFTCEKIRTKESMARAAENERPRRPDPAACTLVSEAEMSAILGAPVVTDPNLRSGNKCIYRATSGNGPSVELSVDMGGGAAIAAMGALGKAEPGLTSSYAGIGDRAVAAGPALMIKTGDDLVTIVLAGVDDFPATAKKIFDTAKPRM